VSQISSIITNHEHYHKSLAALSSIINIITKTMDIPVITAQVALWIKEAPTYIGYWRHNAQELVNSRQWGRTSLVAE